jgi:hypothetical protein
VPTTELQGLTARHYKMLSHDSAIIDEVIEARGYASLSPSAEQLSSYNDAQKPSDGLWVPGHTVWGEKTAGQFRPDQPRTVISAEGKIRVLKYETPVRATNYLDIHPLVRARVRETNEPLIITEGVKKADSTISRGMLCIALSGVWNWRGKIAGGNGTRVLADFDEIPWKGRMVLVAFDSDIVDNENVQLASRRLCEVLYRRGASPLTVDWGRFDSESRKARA